jgi:putative polyketide hydroxylase
MLHSGKQTETGSILPKGTSQIQVPVLIVGAGPTGLCTSLLLSRYGIPSLLVERHASTSIYPRAVGVSTRTMELFRQWGLNERVRAAGFELADTFGPVLPTLTGPVVGRGPLGFPRFEEALAVSPVTPWACPQDALEPVLLEAIHSYEQARVVFGAELTMLEQDGEAISATILDRTTGEQTLVRAQYVVAADGAHSQIRGQLGIAMEGPDHLSEHLSILFRANLRPLLQGRVYGLYFIQHPEAPGLFVATGANDRWLFAMEWHPERGEQIEDYDSQRCIHLIRTAAGVPDLDVELLGRQAFTFAAQVAQHYQKGNIFLAGDAVHRMTPSGGRGMNTGIHDAHNLTWKLAAVLQGWATPTLLESYESERRPVGLRNTKLSDTRRFIGRREGETRQPEENEMPWSDLELDLAYSYESTAIIPESPTEGGNAATPSRFTCRPGRRAPHVWLTRDGKRISTLDLYDRTLTLLTGSARAAWCEAADIVARTHSVPLVAHLIRPEGELQDDDSHWGETYGIDEDGALLVRPDGFVAWRERGIVRDPKTELSHVVDQIVERCASKIDC